VMRVFSRLGLVSGFPQQTPARQPPALHEPQLLAGLRVGAQLAAATGHPIQYVSMILSAFADDAGVCNDRMPQCYLCAANERCHYAPKAEALRHGGLILINRPSPRQNIRHASG
jgi:hypothetical protein